MISGLLAVLLIVGYIIFSRGSANKQQSSDVEPTEEILPTVDSSVKVDFESIKKGEALLTVKNAPSGTNQIEFELSYMVINADSEEGGSGTVSQGAIGKCTKSNNVWECGEPSASGRKIVLGTCSSGVCRYHNIEGDVNVLLKFTGNYGQKIYEKEFEL